MHALQLFILHISIPIPDDRFILKQVKAIEISAFEDFAPRYLDYISKALEEKVRNYIHTYIHTYIH